MEKNKNEFDDIILEKSNKNEKIKKILLRIIALVILFLVVMIVMKLINGNDDSTQNNITPPEPLSTQNENSDNNGFENVPITQNDSPEDQFEALRRQIEGENSQTALAENNSSLPDTNFSAPSEEPATPPLNVTEQSTQETPKVQEPTPAPAKPKTQPTQTKKPQAPKEPEKSDTKELFKNVETKPVSKDGLTPGLYVQIFSVNNLDQKSKELAAVKKKGYDYKLYKTSINGREITKVLIGPFDKNNISAELEKIRKDVAKDAFSFTLK
ncbi:SPOR domain-containing protein [Campylobacter cuniculorum]|uniref:SPOR domain-containing protein n=2 Tax=Campylobacter cuniculorum TaxID=374106 RepID=A0A1W6BUQ1_9BACT|nr:SPOR domain-containing protein [Campylobacter cuniculorum]ARJ55815.1 hypothetical protein (sporulation domain) [Campylobacter cuniculorum DSM 23162 = LMG 24588]QOR05032.1 SPOR domain-containing protein [Campylobacter cuniculorum]